MEMTIGDLAGLIDVSVVTPDGARAREITCGYACDLLSWVMAHGRQGMAWVTVQTHLNVVAVAALHEMSCIIIPEGIQIEQAAALKARDEGVAMLRSNMTAYQICGLMFSNGVPAVSDYAGRR